MSRLASLNGVNETLPARPKLTSVPKTERRLKIVGLLGDKTVNLQGRPLQITRRLALGLASIVLAGNSENKVSLAFEPTNNGFWYDFPLPVPSVDNKLANEATGTRSFLKKGLYMADIGVKGRIYRLRKYAFDLLALGDLIGPDTLNYVRRYLRIKSTFMYYDFDKVITAAPVDDKQPLLDLANRLFDKFEKLEDASKRKDLPQTESSYKDTTVILQEVMDRMA